MRTKILCFICFAAILAGCKQEPSSASVTRRDVEGYIVLTGQLVTPPTDFADVLPPYHAPVEKVMVTEGKWVREGEVLMTLSFPDVQAGLEQARLNMKNAQAAYANARTSLDDEVKRIDAELSALKSEQAQGKDVTDRLTIAQQQLFDAKRMLQSNMAPYQADIDTAKYNLDQIQSGAKLGSIRAPISGTVLKVYAQAGQMVGDDRTKPIATICDLAALMVQAPLAQDQLGWVKRRTEVKVTFEGIAEEFPGRVERIITRTEDNGFQYIAMISFKNKQGLAKPGANVKGIAVKTGEAKGVIAVPAEAVDKDSTGKPIVNVLENGKWIPRVVEVGLSGGGYTEIKSGLKEGETVQVTP